MATSRRAAVELDIDLTARAFAALDAGDVKQEPDQSALNAAERRVVARVEHIARVMGAEPRTQDGLDPDTVAALRLEPSHWYALLAKQRLLLGRAGHAERHATAFASGAAIAAIASAGAAAAALGPPDRRRSLLAWASFLVALSLISAFLGFLP